jgi:hypothetical protein
MEYENQMLIRKLKYCTGLSHAMEQNRLKEKIKLFSQYI